MSDVRGFDRPPRRGMRPGAVAALVVLAFVIGVALAVYVLRAQRTAEKEAAATSPAKLVAPTPSTAAVATANAAAVDPVTLATRESTLAAQLSALEARAAVVDMESAAAGDQATRAEAILTAAAVRRALDRGQPLGHLEMPLRARFGRTQPQAVAIILQAARQPVTLETLRSGIDTVAADLVVDQHDDWLGQWRRELGRLVVLRKAETPVDTPADRLERVRLLLDIGQVEAARAEIARMPGADEATAWNAAAVRYVQSRRALDRIEAAALIQPVAVAPPVAF